MSENINFSSNNSLLDVLGGFVYDYINSAEFEKYLYKNIEHFGNLLDMDLFLELISANYNNKNDVIHLKYILKKYLKYGREKYNDAYFELLSKFNSDIQYLIRNSSKTTGCIVLDLSNIKTEKELHELIKLKFNFPYWYGMNWEAFDDIVDFSEIKEIQLIGLENMKKVLVEDSEIFYNYLVAKSGNNCKIIIQNK